MPLVVKNPSVNAGDSRDSCSIPELGRSPGEGNGYLPQYSCLENSMDRGAWWSTVHGVTKSWIWLSDWYFHFFFHPLPNMIFFLSFKLLPLIDWKFHAFLCLFLVGKTSGCLQICDAFSICLFPRLLTMNLQLYFWLLLVPWEINYVLGWRNELILNDGVWNLKHLSLSVDSAPW